MDHDRRTFLKTTSLVGMAAMTGASLATDAAAQTGAKPIGPTELPKGMTFATLRRPDAAGGGFGLGLRTDRGILDVVAAEQDFHEGAPTSIDAVFKGQGDINGLKRLVDKARASPSAQRYFVAPEQAAFGPCVTNPEKIVCIGLNYRRHAAETGNPVPKQPILFNKYNTAFNCHGGVIGVSEEDAQKFDYEAELVIVIGRRARNVRKRTRSITSSAMPPATISPRATCSRDRANGCSARVWTDQRRWARGSSPPIRWTAIISRSNAASTARCGSLPTPRTWCSTASSS
jgi:hypothetical protein